MEVLIFNIVIIILVIAFISWYGMKLQIGFDDDLQIELHTPPLKDQFKK